MIIIVCWSSYTISVILVRLMKHEFSQQSFEKFPNIKFHENPSRWNRVVPFGQTDRYDKLIVAFRNFAKAPKIKTPSPFLQNTAI